jgi:cellobiose phosphorylase
LGYTIVGSTYQGIEAQVRYFVPLGESLEVWGLTVTNRREESAHLSLFSSIEFCLWDAHDDASNFQRNFSIGQVEVEDGVIYHKTEYRERRDHFAFFACSEETAGFDTQRDVFLGPYRAWLNPLAVERGESFDSVAHGWAPMGSHHVRVRLEPGESRQVVFLLGYHENPRDQKFDPPNSQTINKRTVVPIIMKYLDPVNVDTAFNALRDYWDDLLGIFQVESPHAHTDRMVNIWNAYQCMVTFNLSRSASLFESGIGRGMGFRDSNQDLLGFAHMIPGRARERILDLAATQLETGGAYHQYQPLTKRGNDQVGGDFNDDPLWLILSVAAYLKETGDRGILDEEVVYENRPGTQQPLYEHLGRSLGYTLDRLGPAGATRPAAHRPRRLERLPEPEHLLRGARRILPDHDGQRWQDRRIGLYRRYVRTGCQGAGRHRPGARPGGRGSALPGSRCSHGDGGPGGRLGRRLVPARL